jgi:hypothetical protein
VHPRVADGQHETGDTDGQQQYERQDVLGEPLHRRRSVIEHAPTEGEQNARDDEEGGPHQTMKDDEGDNGVNGEVPCCIAEHIGSVDFSLAGHRLEVDPSPNKRERDGGRDDAAPHDAPVRRPP